MSHHRRADRSKISSARLFWNSARWHAGECRIERVEPRLLLSGTGLDSTFGGGAVMTDYFGEADYAYAVAALPGGKLLVAGRASENGGDDFALARYNADGTLDATFGVGGRVSTDLGSDADDALAMAVQGDGKIVLAGQTQRGGSFFDFAVVRYNSDGSLDGGFGNGGVATVDFAGGFDQAHAVAVRPDGKLVLAGVASVGGSNDFALAQLNADGSLDATFGIGGRVTTAFDSADANAAAMLLQPDGKIVMAGSVMSTATWTTDVALARYNVDGSLDGGFGAGGVVVQDMGSADEALHGLALGSGGMLLVAGGAGGDFLVARFKADGMLDGSFGAAGQVRLDFAGDVDQASQVLVEADGTLVVVGTAMVDGDAAMAIAHLGADGAPDAAFGTAGRLTTNVAPGDEMALAATDSGDGKVAVAGFALGQTTDVDFAVARYVVQAPVLPPSPPPPVVPLPMPTITGPSRLVRGQPGTFTASLAGGGSYQMSWSFGDTWTAAGTGVGNTGLSVSHAYVATGSYTIKLTLSDSDGQTATATRMVTVDIAAMQPDSADPTKLNLVVGGTNGGDVILFLPAGRLKGVGLFVNCRFLGYFNPTGRVIAFGQGGNDLISAADLTLPAELHGGAGNDLLIGGRAADVLVGDGGRDRMIGGSGVDQIITDAEDAAKRKWWECW